MRVVLPFKPQSAVVLLILFNMKFRPNKQSGYSLVEVLIAITVLLISIVGPLTIAQAGLKNASLAKQQNTAFFLAQEGLEVVVKMREDDALPSYVSNPGDDVWSESGVLGIDDLECTSDTPCGVDIANSELFRCDADGETCDLYLFDSGRDRYRHDSTGGEATRYRREISVNVNDTRLHVTARVNWGEDSDEQVELETYIYNIYEN